jgi:hypothetical protein
MIQNVVYTYNYYDIIVFSIPISLLLHETKRYFVRIMNVNSILDLRVTFTQC